MPLYAELQIGPERIIYPMPVPQGKEHYRVVRVLEGSTLYDRKYTNQPLHLFNGELLWGNEMSKEPEIQTTEIIARPGDTDAKAQAESTMNQLIDAIRKEVERNPGMIATEEQSKVGFPAFNPTGNQMIDDLKQRFKEAESEEQVEERRKANQKVIKKASADIQKRLLEMSESMPPEKRDKIRAAVAVSRVAEQAADIIKDHAENPSGNLWDKIGQVAEDKGLINPYTQFKSGGKRIPVVDEREYVIRKPAESTEEPDPEICKHRRTDYFIGTGIICRDCKKKLRV